MRCSTVYKTMSYIMKSLAKILKWMVVIEPSSIQG